MVMVPFSMDRELRSALVICLWSLMGRSLLLWDWESSSRLKSIGLVWCLLRQTGGQSVVESKWVWKKCFYGVFFLWRDVFMVFIGAQGWEENVRCYFRGFGRFLWFFWRVFSTISGWLVFETCVCSHPWWSLRFCLYFWFMQLCGDLVDFGG